MLNDWPQGQGAGGRARPDDRYAVRRRHDAAVRDEVIAFRIRVFRETHRLDDEDCAPFDDFDETGLVSAWSEGRIVGCVTANQMAVREFPERSIYRRYLPPALVSKVAAFARPDETIREFARLAGDPADPGATVAILHDEFQQSRPPFVLTAALSAGQMDIYDRLGHVSKYAPLGGRYCGMQDFFGRPTSFQVFFDTECDSLSPGRRVSPGQSRTGSHCA